jgi:hypothetical protein
MMRSLILLGCLSLARPATGSDPSASLAVEVDLNDLGPVPGKMAGVIGRFEADHGSLMRSAPPAGSQSREDLKRRFLDSWLKALAAFDYDAMGVDDRIDYLLLKNRIEHDLRRIAIDARTREEVGCFVPFAPIILGLDAEHRRMERPDARKAADAMDRLAREVDAAKKRAEGATKPSKAVANRGLKAVAGLRRTLKDYRSDIDGYDPIFTWWTAEPYKAADKALDGYETFLRETLVGLKPNDKTTIIGDPIGEAGLVEDLRSAMIPYSPAELIKIAETEFAWCDAEMLRASREMGCGDDWKKALERVKGDHVGPGEQPGMIRELAIESTRFVEEHELLTIPALAKDSWRMEMMSPDRQLVNPFFTGGEVISVSFPTSGMTHEQKLMSMRGNNRHFSRATVHHELIPGHHLQAFMADRYRSYRQVFSTPFWIEGWALYWEMTLWDKGFPKTAEDRVGFLFWRMHRCARIIFSLKFHLGQMTPQECIDFLVERVGHERENATAEVRRSFNGDYGPLYQCAYMLGAIQFRALHKELVGSKTMTDRQFHDAILRENMIPIELVRAILSQQKLPRDFTTGWKFAGERPGSK